MGIEANHNIELLVKNQESKVIEAFKKTALKFAPKIVSQAQLVHPYNNQTYRLTHTTNAIYLNEKDTLKIYAPAANPKNGYMYGKKVAEIYDENWLKTAYRTLKPDFEQEFLKEVSK